MLVLPHKSLNLLAGTLCSLRGATLCLILRGCVLFAQCLAEPLVLIDCFSETLLCVASELLLVSDALLEALLLCIQLSGRCELTRPGLFYPVFSGSHISGRLPLTCVGQILLLPKI